jgi:NTE family protein
MSSSSSPPNNNDNVIENVLILQGGGSLGAFGCGVFKGLAINDIRLDIIAGTSIGGINGAIIAGGKDREHPERLLEQFWLELSENYIDINKSSFDINSQFVERVLFPLTYHPYLSSSSTENEKNLLTLTKTNENYYQKVKNLQSFYSSAIFGNDKMFKPRWMYENPFSDPNYFSPSKWTYIYDHSPLVKTLEKYIDYDKLKPDGNPNSRLILTAVNILTAEPLTFDSSKQQITPKHILATSSYPLYNFRWTEVEKGIYAWDGSLLSNTPLREVLDASPINNKRIFLVENYPKKVESLPKNLPEVYHRARDIMFSDKTEHNIQMSKVFTHYLHYIDELYNVIEKFTDTTKLDKKQLKRIRSKYKKIKKEHGAEIKDIFYISRDETNPSIFENADFSPQSIKNSIEQGEKKTIQVLNDGNSSNGGGSSLHTKMHS